MYNVQLYMVLLPETKYAYSCPSSEPVKLIIRVHTHTGKLLDLIIRIPGLEYTGISSKVLENTGMLAYFLVRTADL